jgi:hypothetical protein
MRTAPVYKTRVQYDIDKKKIYPTTFNNAHQLLRLPSLASKTGEITYLIRNRTVWTNNKRFKSRMRPDPNCEGCAEKEKQLNTFFECSHYSQLIWIRLVDLAMQVLNSGAQVLVPRLSGGKRSPCIILLSDFSFSPICTHE